MKKCIFWGALVLIAGNTAVFAQQTGGGNPRGNRVGTNQNRDVNRTNRPVRRDRSTDVSNRTRQREIENRPDIKRHKPKKITKLLSGLNLSELQKRKTNQILKEARENGTPKNEVLREINSILSPRQSEKFKKKIKRIYQNQNGGEGGDGNPADGSDTP